jgi:hypothetical protein
MDVDKNRADFRDFKAVRFTATCSGFAQDVSGSGGRSARQQGDKQHLSYRGRVSRKRTKAQAKRRPKRSLTPEQRIAIELRRMREYQQTIAKRDQEVAEIMDAMRGEGSDYRSPKGNEFDRWEMSELARRNKGRCGNLMLRLPDGAYEAERLGRYVEARN